MSPQPYGGGTRTSTYCRSDRSFSREQRQAGQSTLEPLKEAIIPGITMMGNFSGFYKIKVTDELNYAILHCQYPEPMTRVHRHTPRVPRRNLDGMKPLDNRKLVVRCCEAFKQVDFPPQQYVLYVSLKPRSGDSNLHSIDKVGRIRVQFVLDIVECMLSLELVYIP